MCTAISMINKDRCYFGRNMDIPFFFKQRPIYIPKGFKYLNRTNDQTENIERSILGMGSVIDEHPAMAEAMNEKGLTCAGLNFAGYAHFGTDFIESKENITPYDFILWALSKHDSIEHVKQDIENINFVSIAINDKTPVSQLHWMLCDRSGASIVVECTKHGIKVYDNPVGVMTNNPEFPWHLTNLNEYLKLSSAHPESITWSKLELNALGVGAGSIGLPGDYASVSRFVRAAFSRANTPKPLAEENECAQFFHMLDSCAMPKGCVKTMDGLYDFTVYSSCMDLERLVYYYKCYENNRINAVRFPENSDLTEYPYCNTQDINFIN